MATLRAPFPYFGGKRHIAHEVWRRFGRPKQYIEPFCGSAAVLLAAPEPACLEVIGDCNGFIANFWRAVKFLPNEIWQWADYPVSHIDLAARHAWFKQPQRIKQLTTSLLDPDWPGDSKIAGWWLWGQCASIGGVFCEWNNYTGRAIETSEMGCQVSSGIPFVSDAGQGIQALNTSTYGIGLTDIDAYKAKSLEWLRTLSTRLTRVRVLHADWTRCLNYHYGDKNGITAVFLDPPYKAFEDVYPGVRRIAEEVSAWAKEHATDTVRIALAGHVSDYDLPEWDTLQWTRSSNTYGSTKTRDQECIWFSPGCIKVTTVKQLGLFEVAS